MYSGSDPIQRGVEPGTIKAIRGAVLRGRVLDRAGDALPGVRVAVLDHPEYGRTLSRADGRFDMAVNGGGALTVDYSLDGYLPSQRQVDVPWQDFVDVDEVRLVILDPAVTNIEVSDEIQVARSSPVSDADGERRVTMLFAPGTHATMLLADGTRRDLPSMHVRATEYTVGPGGPDAMPGSLPATSAYTYAAEFTVDEARAAGATSVDFDHPVAAYVENFLDMPVGTHVPSGYYDRKLGTWLADPDGRVIKLLTASPDPTIDSDGDGQADTPAQLEALGIDSAELGRLGGLYPAGTTLWRVQTDHFRDPDLNWGWFPPDDARLPRLDPFKRDPPKADDWHTCVAGCIITAHEQTLGERVDVTGTPFTLNYHSDRSPGRRDSYMLHIPLSDSSIPSSLLRIELGVRVAGRTYRRTFPAAPNLSTTYVWDGKDAYGRTVDGVRTATVRVGYVYQAVYRRGQSNYSFGDFGDDPMSFNLTRLEIVEAQEWIRGVGMLSAKGQASLGGWTLSPHHAYDPASQTLHLGDGEQRSAASALVTPISTVAGSGPGAGSGGTFDGDGGPATSARLNQPQDVALAPDGSMYIADQQNERIRRVAPDGVITTVAGTGQYGFSGDGGPATDAKLQEPYGVAVGTDGSLYIADTYNGRLRRVSPDGTITTIAAGLDHPYDVAVGPDGAVYAAILDGSVQRVTPDGRITTVAGGHGWSNFGGDGGLATRAFLSRPFGIAIAADGTLYIADLDNARIRRVTPDGIITTIAGNGSQGFSGDGGPATDAAISLPTSVAVGPDGSVYFSAFTYKEFSQGSGCRVRRVLPDGTISTLLGALCGSTGDAGPAAASRLQQPEGLTVGPDSSLYIADTFNHRVRRVASVLPRFVGAGDIVIASTDGSQIYIFNSNGRHLRTLDALTHDVIYRFAYDANGRLESITDVDGNITRVARDADGTPTAIVAPGGQRTELQLSNDGYLSRIADPADDRVLASYDAGGLLTHWTDARDNSNAFEYDDSGRLTRDTGPGDAVQTFTRTDEDRGFSVTHRTAEGRTSTYRLQRTPLDAIVRTMIDSNGAQTTTAADTDGTVTTTYPDGTRSDKQLGPDPRFGMQSPVTRNVTVTTPGGLVSTLQQTRTVTLTNPADPLSLVTQTDTISRNGQTSTTTYDASTRTTTQTSPEGRHQSTTLDADGHVVRVEPGDGLAPLLVTYDGQGRPTHAEQGDQSWTYAYDALNRLTSMTDAAGQRQRFSYDAADRVSSIIQPSGRAIGLSHDASGNPTSLTSPEGATAQLGYTARDQLSSFTPSGSAASQAWAYDRDRALASTTLAGGGEITRDRDSGGRLTSQIDSTATTSASYADQTSRISDLTRTPNAGGPAQQLTLTHDGGPLTHSAASGSSTGQFGFTYDSDYRLSSITLTSGANTIDTAIQRDHDGLATSDGPFTIARGGPAGAVSAISDNAMSLDYARDGVGRLSARTQHVAGETRNDLHLTRDNRGSITSRTQTRSGTDTALDYTYDDDGQLLRVDHNNTPLERYTYDDNGNRTNRQIGDGSVEHLSYDGQQRLAQRGDVHYTFNSDGFLSARGDDTFHYSPTGELLEATVGAQTVSYAYDGVGRRVSRTLGTDTTQYLYGDPADPFRVSAVRDPDGTLAAYYYDEEGHLFAMQRDNSRFYIATDQVGTPVAVIDAAGSPVKTLSYDTFGVLLSDSAPDFELPFGFAGGLTDPATGLTRFGLRDYEPQTGRWTARDPLLLGGGQTNLYEYVGNDPVALRDPTGLAINSQFITGGAHIYFGSLGMLTGGGTLYLSIAALELPIIGPIAARYGIPLGIWQVGKGALAVHRGGTQIVRALDCPWQNTASNRRLFFDSVPFGNMLEGTSAGRAIGKYFSDEVGPPPDPNALPPGTPSDWYTEVDRAFGGGP